eukprot:2609804-Pyramimonas_sp.AAC.1
MAAHEFAWRRTQPYAAANIARQVRRRKGGQQKGCGVDGGEKAHRGLIYIPRCCPRLPHGLRRDSLKGPRTV